MNSTLPEGVGHAAASVGVGMSERTPLLGSECFHAIAGAAPWLVSGHACHLGSGRLPGLVSRPMLPQRALLNEGGGRGGAGTKRADGLACRMVARSKGRRDRGGGKQGREEEEGGG